MLAPSLSSELITVNERNWDEHPCFKASDKYYRENSEAFLGLFEKDNDCAFLDLGCHDGSLTLRVAKKIETTKIYGLEVSKAIARKAKEKGINVDLGDLNKVFPFSNEAFDVISANQILEHLWNTDNFFREINRVLKTNGYAVISTPNLSSLHSIYFILLGQQTPVIQLVDMQVGNSLRGIRVDSPHQKAFNIPALRDLSIYYGFQVEQIEGSGFYFVPSSLQRVAKRVLAKYAIYLTIKIRKIRNLPTIC